MIFPAPKVEAHDGVLVVRDDLLAGGTKVRYLAQAFNGAEELVYASPAYGGAQLALAYAARTTGKRATIFTAKRADPHARTKEARAAGARVFLVPFGRLNVVQARAKAYVASTPGARLIQFGGESEAALSAIAEVGRRVWGAFGPFDEVWSAAGSGVLTRGLQRGMPSCPRFFAVQVGTTIKNPGRASVIKSPVPFDEEWPERPPFPSCPNYDAKAWSICRRRRGNGRVLFWNVMAPSPTRHA